MKDIVMLPLGLLSLTCVCLGISILTQSTYGDEVPIIWSLSNVFTDGDNITLKCSLIAEEPVTFKWTSPHKINNEKRMQYEEDLGGITEYSDFISFSARKVDNNKAFTCSASSSGQTLESAPYVIYVFITPYVPHVFGPSIVKENSGLHTWTCMVLGATLMPPTVTWRHMGRTLTEILDITTNVTNVDNVLEFVVQLNLTMTLPADVYSYPLECQFETDFAREHTTRTQIHSVVITWTRPRTYPSSKDFALYRANEHAFLNCTIRTNSIDGIRWNKDYLTLSKTTSLRGSYHQEGSQMWWTVLMFKISSMDNDRNYTCEVMGVDDLPMVASDPVTVYVYQPPHIVFIHVPEVARYRDLVMVECLVQNASFIIPTITWIDEHKTIYEGEITLEINPSVYENNLLVYEVRSKMNVTLPKVHSKAFTCIVSHGYGPMTYTENKTATVKIIWDHPILLPITSQPYYAVLNSQIEINCSMSAQGKVEISFVKEYDVVGLQSRDNSKGLDHNLVHLHWKYISFNATLMDNARFFSCAVNIDGKTITSEPLIIFVIQTQGELLMTGPVKIDRGIDETWTCRVSSGSISVPTVTWLVDNDEAVSGVLTSVYTTEVPNYNFIHDVVSNLTYSFYTDVLVDLMCISVHKVATYYDKQEAAKRITVGTPEPKPARSFMRSVNAFKVLQQDPFVVCVNLLMYLTIVTMGTGALAAQHLPQ